MTDVVFSSWKDEIIDNRGKGPGEFLEAKGLNIPADYDKEAHIKAFMGWDGLVVREPGVNVVDMARAYVETIQGESCGKCVPCRVGTRVMLDVMNRIADGRGKMADLGVLRRLGEFIRDGSKCTVGQTGTKPVLDAIEYFKGDFEEVIKGKKKVPKGVYKAKLTAPCMSACPSHLDIPTYIEYIREGKFDESLAVIREATCLPGTLGRVCIRPCEENCRRANIDEPLSIKYLKRFVADYEIEKRHIPLLSTAPEEKEDKVAIIGAGPAGLSCAYYLALKGYPVTIFERFPESGGMAAWGIPDYRLPRDILQREVEIIRSMGVEIRYGVHVGKDITLEQIFQEGFKALFIGVGAQGSTPMRVEGEDKGYEGFIPGVTYLLDVNKGEDPYPEGRRVVVVGGGNVAIDCVRSSFRVGKKDVNLFYRRSRKEMPADDVEIHDAEEEEVKFHYLCVPTKVIAKGGKVVGVECIRMELGEPDDSGRRRPVPVAGSEFYVDTDIVIPAIGQSVDLSFMEEKDGIETTKWGTLSVDEQTLETSREGVFSAGDCVTGPDVLVRAAGNGKRAADKIDQYLRGLPVSPTEDDKLENLMTSMKVYDAQEKIRIIGGRERKQLQMLPPKERKWTFEEVERGFSVPDAMKEADRCLRCYRIGLVATSG
jgi:formate dehydrogenase beta subunit